MINVLEKFYSACLDDKEHFGNNSRLRQVLPLILSVLTVELLVLFLGKYLWNNYLVGAVTFVNPVTSVVQLFAITVLLRLLIN
mgnify:CR=1 FL=1